MYLDNGDRVIAYSVLVTAHYSYQWRKEALMQTFQQTVPVSCAWGDIFYRSFMGATALFKNSFHMQGEEESA